MDLKAVMEVVNAVLCVLFVVGVAGAQWLWIKEQRERERNK